MIFKFRKQNNNKTIARPKLVCGFTLVEMVVVVAIIIVVTSVVLLKQSKFSSDILVTNAAYEVALAIRQAQVYGISSKQIAGDNPNVGYGIYLSVPTSGGVMDSFKIYSDTGLNPGSETNDYPFSFTTGNSEYAEVDNPRLTQGQTIRRFCADGVCSPVLNTLNIGFIKPKPEALINKNGAASASKAIIVVQSALGDKCRVVSISSIGQISVDAPLSSGLDCDQTN